VTTAKQDWERVFGDRAIEVLESNNSDLSHALAACMEWLGIEYGYVGEYEVYMTDNGGAEAIRVDVDGTRKRLPSVIEERRRKDTE
jgi:hypothetical protein